MQTPSGLLLAPSPLLSNIHFWSSLSPVGPLSPAQLQSHAPLFQVTFCADLENSSSLKCLMSTCEGTCSVENRNRENLSISTRRLHENNQMQNKPLQLSHPANLHFPLTAPIKPLSLFSTPFFKPYSQLIPPL